MLDDDQFDSLAELLELIDSIETQEDNEFDFI